jgi:hypothetical protein
MDEKGKKLGEMGDEKSREENHTEMDGVQCCNLTS